MYFSADFESKYSYELFSCVVLVVKGLEALKKIKGTGFDLFRATWFRGRASREGVCQKTPQNYSKTTKVS